jgi:hypothetical protein
VGSGAAGADIAAKATPPTNIMVKSAHLSLMSNVTLTVEVRGLTEAKPVARRYPARSLTGTSARTARTKG